jgi:hypothetical protein
MINAAIFDRGLARSRKYEVLIYAISRRIKM